MSRGCRNARSPAHTTRCESVVRTNRLDPYGTFTRTTWLRSTRTVGTGVRERGAALRTCDQRLALLRSTDGNLHPRCSQGTQRLRPAPALRRTFYKREGRGTALTRAPCRSRSAALSMVIVATICSALCPFKKRNSDGAFARALGAACLVSDRGHEREVWNAVGHKCAAQPRALPNVIGTCARVCTEIGHGRQFAS